MNNNVYAIENHPNDSRVTLSYDGIVQALTSRMGTGGGNTPMTLYELKENSSGDGIATTLDASYYKEAGFRNGCEREYVLTTALCAGNGQLHQTDLTPVMDTLDCMHDQKMILHDAEESMEETNRKYVLRRLTPVECARLQGFPDWWCDGANGSDSAQYKLWGNGIALPCAVDVLGRIAKELKRSEGEG